MSSSFKVINYERFVRDKERGSDENKFRKLWYLEDKECILELMERLNVMLVAIFLNAFIYENKELNEQIYECLDSINSILLKIEKGQLNV